MKLSSVHHICFFYYRVYEKYGGESPVTFASWMQFGLPLSFIMLVILWIWLMIYFL